MRRVVATALAAFFVALLACAPVGRAFASPAVAATTASAEAVAYAETPTTTSALERPQADASGHDIAQMPATAADLGRDVWRLRPGHVAHADEPFKVADLLLTGAGGGAAAYVPNASLVTEEFSPSITLTSASPTFVFYQEFRCAEGTTTFQPDKYQSCFGTILAGTFADVTCGGFRDAEHTPGLTVINENAAAGGVFRFNLNNASCGANNSALASYTGTNVLADGLPHSLLVYGDVTCSSATNQRCGGVYLDGALLGGVVFADQGGGGWTGTKTIAFNVNPFYINAWNGGQAAGRFEVGRTYLDLNSGVSPTLANSNTPSFDPTAFGTAATPKNWGSDCSGPLGHSPTVCLQSPAASFLTNSGTGPAPTATQQGTNTVTKQAYAAAIAPGETPDRPYVKWEYDYSWGGDCAEAAATCTQGTNAGHKIVIGDKLCAVITVDTNTANANDAFAMSGWTDVLGGTQAGGVGGQTSMAIFCQTAASNVAAGALMTKPTFTWTANGGGFTVGAHITLIDFGKYGAGGTTPTVAAALSTSSANGSLPLPSCTAPSGNSLWVGVHSTFDWSFSPNTAVVGPPSTSTLIGKLPGATGGNRPMTEVEKIGSAGSINRTAQGSPGNRSVSACLVLD